MRALLAVLSLLPLWASAHTLSDAELHLRDSGGLAQIELSLRLQDLALVVPIDTNGDGDLYWGELEQSAALIEGYLADHLTLQADGNACALTLNDVRVRDYQRSLAAFLVLQSGCPADAGRFELQYDLLFAQDPSHRGILINDLGGGDSFVAGPDSQTWHVTVGQGSIGQTLLSYVRSGIHHIWMGADHLLFVFVLLLPAVLARRQETSGLTVLKQVTLVITAFTLAHSITLGVTTLGWVQPPMLWIELAIAASVAIAALANMLGSFGKNQLLIAFAFGLLHGFGFASVLAEFGLPDQALGIALLGFNLGVEAGQLALVAVCVPLLLLMSRNVAWRQPVLQIGSAAAILIASSWMLERVQQIL